MKNKILVIGVIFLMLGAGIAVSQRTDVGEIRILMLSGKKLLAKGDSIGAKEKFEEVLRLDPNSESAKFLLESIGDISPSKIEEKEEKETASAEETIVPETTVETETVPEKAESPIVQTDADETIISAAEEITQEPLFEEAVQNTAPQDPFSGAIKHKGKGQTPTNTPAAAESKIQPKKIGFTSDTGSKPTTINNAPSKTGGSQDIISTKYYSTTGPQLIHFSNLPSAPLISSCKINAAADVSGKWMSSIRNMRDNGHQMLTLTIDATNGKLDLDGSMSELVRISTDAGYDVSDVKLNNGSNAYKGEIEVRHTANDRQEILRVTDTLLKPFLGEYGLSDYMTYKWMGEGDLVTDTIVTARTVYCAVLPNDSIATSAPLPEPMLELLKTHTEVPDSIILTDSTYVKRRVIPDHYDVSVKFNIDIQTSDKLLPATLDICAVAEAPTRTISIAELSLPLYFVNVPDGYSWTDEQKSTSNADRAWYDKLKAAPKDLHNINNMGYALLNGIGTKEDLAEALKLFERAYSMNSKEACANLYLIYRDGIGAETNMDKALQLLETGRQRHLPEPLYLSARFMSNIKVMDDNATTWLDEAVNMGSPNAIILKARLAEEDISTEANKEEALRLYTLARDLEHPDAGYYVARILLAEDSPSEAYTNAVASAKAGSARAMQMIAEMYITGMVVRQDMRKAVMWLNKLQESVKNQRIGYMYEKQDIN